MDTGNTARPVITERSPDELVGKRGGRARRVVVVVLVVLGVTACLGLSTLLVLLDQTALAAQVYLQSVSSGNPAFAEALGDHFSDQADWQMRFYKQDIQRDVDWLRGAEITDVTTAREQTLSGQWVTNLRFNYRKQGSADPPRQVMLRVKTAKWLALTYIKAVEIVEP
jgi:hypothetical protein